METQPMTEAERLRDDLTRDEGCVRHAYKDSEGWWTIGIGHLIDERQGGRLPDHIINLLLDHDIATARADLNAIAPWWVSRPENIRRGLVNMAFNLGRWKLSGFKKMFAALQDGDYHLASAEALDSRWAYQVGPRANRIAKLFRDAQ